MKKGSIIRFIKDGIPFGKLYVVTKTVRKNVFAKLLIGDANQGEMYIAKKNVVKVDIYTVKTDSETMFLLKHPLPPTMLKQKYGRCWENIMQKVKESKYKPFAIKFISPAIKTPVYIYVDKIDKVIFQNTKGVRKDFAFLSNIRICE